MRVLEAEAVGAETRVEGGGTSAMSGGLLLPTGEVLAVESAASR